MRSGQTGRPCHAQLIVPTHEGVEVFECPTSLLSPRVPLTLRFITPRVCVVCETRTRLERDADAHGSRAFVALRLM